MAEYIQSKILRKNDIQIDDETPLVTSGMIDSFALVDILSKLEEVMHVRIPVGKVQPKDLNTIQQMLATASRVGKPRS